MAESPGHFHQAREMDRQRGHDPNEGDSGVRQEVEPHYEVLR